MNQPFEPKPTSELDSKLDRYTEARLWEHTIGTRRVVVGRTAYTAEVLDVDGFWSAGLHGVAVSLSRRISVGFDSQAFRKSVCTLRWEAYIYRVLIIGGRLGDKHLLKALELLLNGGMAYPLKKLAKQLILFGHETKNQTNNYGTSWKYTLGRRH